MLSSFACAWLPWALVCVSHAHAMHRCQSSSRPPSRGGGRATSVRRETWRRARPRAASLRSAACWCSPAGHARSLSRPSRCGGQTNRAQRRRGPGGMLDGLPPYTMSSSQIARRYSTKHALSSMSDPRDGPATVSLNVKVLRPTRASGSASTCGRGLSVGGGEALCLTMARTASTMSSGPLILHLSARCALERLHVSLRPLPPHQKWRRVRPRARR